jgi:hypothetical protein
VLPTADDVTPTLPPTELTLALTVENTLDVLN